MRFYHSTLALALLFGAPAFAQENAPATDTNQAASDPAAMTVTEPQTFAEMATGSNMFEIMSS
jgi:hypothetical protein